MIILNPTGGRIRNDSGGFGYYSAPRGLRIHKGIDFTIPDGPGQIVVAPITGSFKRISYPYPDDLEIGGGLFDSGDIEIKMFYFRPYKTLVGQKVIMGQPIGIAQDVSKRYPGTGMEPHIHLEVVTINPAILM